MVMLESLFNYVNGATAWVLCLDNETKTYLQKLNHKSIKSIALSEVEDAYPELLIAKEDRSLAEYYFTLSPFCLPSFCLKPQNSNPLSTWIQTSNSSPLP